MDPIEGREMTYYFGQCRFGDFSGQPTESWSAEAADFLARYGCRIVTDGTNCWLERESSGDMEADYRSCDFVLAELTRAGLWPPKLGS